MTDKEMTDQEYVESIVKPIVDNQDDVVTTRALDERGVLIQLTVNQSGRDGRTAKAIRSLLRVFGARSDARINLKIVEPEGSENPIPADNGEAKEKSVPEEKNVPEEKTGQTTEVI